MVASCSRRSSMYSRVEQLVARQPHKLQAAGSSPAPASIRAATWDDFPRIAEMGAPFWALTPHSATIPYDPDAVMWWSRLMMDQGALLVVEVIGEVIGAAGAITSPALGNLAYKVGAEMFWWIEPAHRSSGIGSALLAALENAMREQGVCLFSMMAIETVDPDRAGAIYERAGYRRTERTYTKELVSWQQSRPA